MRGIVVIALALAILTGCKKEQKPVLGDDNKPVAPETYIDGKSEKTDPQLPPMVPHWKETK